MPSFSSRASWLPLKSPLIQPNSTLKPFLNLVCFFWDDIGNEEMIGSIHPRDVHKHVAQHFTQYKHSFKRDLKRKQKRTCMILFLKGMLIIGGYDWLTISVQNKMRCIYIHVENHLRELTHLEFFKNTYCKEGGGFIAGKAIEGFLAEIENEVLMSLCIKKKILRNQSVLILMLTEVTSLVSIMSLREKGYGFLNNNIELRHLKDDSITECHAVLHGQIIHEFLDATEAALRKAGN
ncbi:hypothetical protein Cgig2_022664 [Carnegiea gigantea]|uniref:Uncharacterized protein n=1 Tax=Carnegiea gigantea TaxID=171969 RepID=A0A9Q1GK31_9CARY|nr:hypothetical protein Cgig2_022664 [Carnegiea gigantea]